jgi:hypothetical protein
MKSDLDTIYIDAKNLADADLSGVNNIINSHYTLKNAETSFQT